MSDLPPGRYRIQPARNSIPPPFPVGANIRGVHSRVVSAGNNNVWDVEKLDSGLYILSLVLRKNWFSRDDGKNVVVVPESAAAEWKIQSYEDAYTIEAPGLFPARSRAWNLASTEPGTEVTLRLFEFFPWPQQLWIFLPVN